MTLFWVIGWEGCVLGTCAWVTCVCGALCWQIATVVVDTDMCMFSDDRKTCVCRLGALLSHPLAHVVRPTLTHFIAP
jgi:hypothetical protein